jgi:bifunctional non-homologous end joining protein LigD
MTPRRVEVEVEGRRLKLSNLDKVLYPAVGFTKGQVIDYYTRVGPFILPHLAGRALTLHRFPDGVDSGGFFAKNAPSHRPDWIPTVAVPSSRGREQVEYLIVNELAALVWCANLAGLELHAPMARADAQRRPTAVVFDLDPGAPADVLACCEVALWLRAALDQLGLRAVPKTSGSKGLQLYLGLDGTVDDETAKAFALALAELLERTHPDRVVSRMSRSLRPGKVLVDWSQNDHSKTTIAPYSLRAREHPTVSTPLTWDEVEAALDGGDPGALRFEASAVIERAQRDGDLFAGALQDGQTLPALDGDGA